MAAGADQQTVITFLRERGLSRVKSILILRDLYGMGHAEAKTAVHNSASWSDCREAAEELWDVVEQAFKEDAEESEEL